MNVSKERAEVLRKREELKKKLSCVRSEYAEAKFETRSKELVETELRELIEEVKAIDTQLDTEQETERTQIQAAEIKEVLTDERSTKTMNREQMIASPEYRDLFLKRLMGKEMTEAERRDYDAFTGGLQTGVAAVPTQTANMIFDSVIAIAPMLAEIELLRVPGMVRFAVQGTRAAATVHVENAVTAGAGDTITAITLNGVEFIKIINISASMTAMAIPAFEQWLVKIIAEDLAVVLDNEVINSPNTAGGIADGPAGGWVNGTNQVTYVPANGLTNANILALMALLPSAHHYNAKWVMSNATFYTQVLAMEDANGNPLHKNPIAADGTKQIYGKPVLIDDNVAANEAYFGNFKKVVGNLSSDIKVEMSDAAGFYAATRVYRGLAVFDCDVADPTAIVKLNV